jgi:hypothetical protein
MNKPLDDFDDDLPDMTDEIMNEFKAIKPADLHLGPVEVKPLGKNLWINQYGPKPPGPEIYALDALIAILSCATVWFVINAWIYVFS